MNTRNGRWIIHRSATVHADPFIAVTEDAVTRPDGSPGTYATVRMRPGVSVLPVADDSTVYLVRQYRYALRGERIETVCGGIDASETPEQAALRELQEETGITASLLIPAGRAEMDGSIVLNNNFLFIARQLGFGPPRREMTEQIETVPMPLDKAISMVYSGEIDHAPSALLILKAPSLLRSTAV